MRRQPGFEPRVGYAAARPGPLITLVSGASARLWEPESAGVADAMRQARAGTGAAGCSAMHRGTTILLGSNGGAAAPVLSEATREGERGSWPAPTHLARPLRQHRHACVRGPVHAHGAHHPCCRTGTTAQEEQKALGVSIHHAARPAAQAPLGVVQERHADFCAPCPAPPDLPEPHGQVCQAMQGPVCRQQPTPCRRPKANASAQAGRAVRGPALLRGARSACAVSPG